MISVLVRCEHAAGRAAAARLRRRARAFLAALGAEEAELSLSLVADREIRALNRDWRGKDSATDVLSFPQRELAPADAATGMLGDVVISLDTARRVARDEGRRVEDELDRYLAHGILHLLGHDHLKARDARAMAAVEERLLAGAGLVGAAIGPAAKRGRGSSAAAKRATRPAARRRG